MTVLTVIPKSKKELQMVEKILDALKIQFEEKEDDLNVAQKIAIDEALESVANGKVFSHKEALAKINAKRPHFLR